MQKGTCGLYFLSTPVRKGKIQLVENTGVSKNIAGWGGGWGGKVKKIKVATRRSSTKILYLLAQSSNTVAVNYLYLWDNITNFLRVGY